MGRSRSQSRQVAELAGGDHRPGYAQIAEFAALRLLQDRSPAEAVPEVLQGLAECFGARAALVIRFPVGDKLSVLAAYPGQAAADPVLLTQISALGRRPEDPAASGGFQSAQLSLPGDGGQPMSALLCRAGTHPAQPDWLLALVGQRPGWDERARSAADAVAAILFAGLRVAGDAAELAELRALDEGRFRQLAELAPVGIARTDTTGQIMFVNERWSTLTGVSGRDAVGSTWAQVVHPADVRRVEQARAAAFADGAEFRADCRLRHSGRDEIWVQVSVTAVQGLDGKPAGGLAALTNISSRKREERERAQLLAAEQQARRSLADQTQRLRSLIAVAIPGVLVTDEHGVIAQLNQSFCAMFGLAGDPAQRTGGSVIDLVREIKKVFADPAEFIDRTGEAFERREPVSGEQMRCGDGRTLQCDYWPVLVDGAYRGDLWLAWDVTGRAELERQRERTIEAELAARELAELAQQQLAEQNWGLQEAAREKTQYLAAVSHELGTPISSIVSFVELVRQDTAGAVPEVSDYLDVIERNAAQLGHMLGELSLLGRIEAGVLPLELTAISVPALVEEEISSASASAARRGITIEFTADEGPPVEGDRYRLREVLGNLLGNAVKFSADGSQVTVSATWDGAWWRIEVEDCGIGIPPGELGKIFDRFSRASNARIAGVPGTGLGLSIVKAITELHGGRVEARSTVGGPTTFLVRLPAVPPSARPE